MTMRFAAVISHPIQHYSPIFTELASREGVTVKVFYLTDHGTRESYDEGFGQAFGWDVPLAEGHDHEFLSSSDQAPGFGFWNMDAPELPAKLAEFSPDLVWIHGYAHRANWRALLWTRKHARSLFFGDSELLHHRSLITRMIKTPLVRWFFRRCDAFFTIGDNNENYYRHYGVPERKLVRGACPVDMGRFTLTTEQRNQFRAEIRDQFGIPQSALVMVFSGKFQNYKRPLDLLEALALLPKETGETVHLLFIGEGPQRLSMEQRAVELAIERQVHITGFINQKDMPRYLAAGDVLAVTSERDAHPLTVTEALPYGMPIIASDRVGCVGAADTARPGENALVYRCGDVAGLARQISKLLNSPELRLSMGEASRQLAPLQDVTVAADAVLSVLKILQECGGIHQAGSGKVRRTEHQI